MLEIFKLSYKTLFMKHYIVLLPIIIAIIFTPFLLMAETNEIVILIKDSNKYFNERNFDKYLEVSKKLYSKNKKITSQMVEILCKSTFEKIQQITTEIQLGKIDDNTNYIKLNEISRLVSKSKKFKDEELNEFANSGMSESAIIYDNQNNIIEFCETIASYKLKNVLQELKNSKTAKVYFEKQDKWLYQYDINTKDIEILTTGLLSNEYRDWNSNGIFNIKIDFNSNSKTYQMFLGHENQYYIKEFSSCEGDYSVKNNKVFSDIILNYSIFNNSYLYFVNLDSDYLKTLPLPTQEIACKLKMDNIYVADNKEYCPISNNEKYSYLNSGSTVEIICSKHGKLIKTK